ncbi:hypothetical protein [Nocardia heshunensis]
MTPSIAIAASVIALISAIWSQRWYRATEFAKQRRMLDIDSTIDAVQALIRLSQAFKLDDPTRWRDTVLPAVIESEARAVRLWVFGRESRHAMFEVTEYVDRILSEPGRSGIDDREWNEFQDRVRIAVHAVRAEIDSIVGTGDGLPPGLGR